jgi:hypothetical protein
MFLSDPFWLIFAHELGHNFGADHPFGNNAATAGTFGGIMDYGDGTLDGIYQVFSKQQQQQQHNKTTNKKTKEISTNLENDSLTLKRIEMTFARY